MFGKRVEPGENIGGVRVLSMTTFAARYLLSGRDLDANRICTAILKGSSMEEARKFALQCLASTAVTAGRFDEAEAIILALVAASAQLQGEEKLTHVRNLFMLSRLYRARGFLVLADKVLAQLQGILDNELVPRVPQELLNPQRRRELHKAYSDKQLTIKDYLDGLGREREQLIAREDLLNSPEIERQIDVLHANEKAALNEMNDVTERIFANARVDAAIELYLLVLRTRWELSQSVGKDDQGFDLLQRLAQLLRQYNDKLLYPVEALAGFRYLVRQGQYEQARSYLALARMVAKADIGFPFDPPEPLPNVFNNPAAESLFGSVNRSGVAARSMGMLAHVYIEEGKLDEARRFINAAMAGAVFAFGKDSEQVAALRYDLARIDRRQGKNAECLAGLMSALSLVTAANEEAALLPGGRTVELMQSREGIPLELIDVLVEHPALLNKRQRDEILFAAFQSMRRPAVESAIAAASIRHDQIDPGKKALVDRYLAAGRNIVNIRAGYAKLSAGEGAGAGLSDARGKLTAELEAQQALLKQLSAELAASGDSDTTGLGKPQTLENVETGLLEGEMLIQFAFSAERGYVLGTMRGRQVLGVVQRGRASVRSDVEALLRELAPIGHEQQPEGRGFPLDRALGLYQEALSGILDELSDVKRLIFVADGVWEGLPFGVLVRKVPSPTLTVPDYDQVDWLFRKYEIAYLPSPATLVKLRIQRGSLARKDILGVGSPTGPVPMSPVRGAYVASLLPQPTVSEKSGSVAAGELEQIRTLVGPSRARILVGPQATKSFLRHAGIENFKVLIFATHGYLASEILEISEPALLMTAEAGANRPDYLTATDIASIRLDANLVLLNACNTAGSDGLPGSEALTGLASAFFFAGARSLIVSLWPVEDDTATSVGVETMRLAITKKNAGVAALLQGAMLHALLSGPGYMKHPAYWAPYVVVGDAVVVPLGDKVDRASASITR